MLYLRGILKELAIVGKDVPNPTLSKIFSWLSFHLHCFLSTYRSNIPLFVLQYFFHASTCRCIRNMMWHMQGWVSCQIWQFHLKGFEGFFLVHQERLEPSKHCKVFNRLFFSGFICLELPKKWNVMQTSLWNSLSSSARLRRYSLTLQFEFLLTAKKTHFAVTCIYSCIFVSMFVKVFHVVSNKNKVTITTKKLI